MSRINTLLTACLAGFMMVLPSQADKATEDYVEENANIVLDSLNDPALDGEARTDAFAGYMEKFTDINLVSNFAIGKYVRQFTPAELERYRGAFRTYALAVYEQQLDQYRGENVVVLGSVDRSARDSIVNTRVRHADGHETDVRWRVLNRNDEYQVVDVALNIDGNLIWLAIEQRAQFLALLDRTNGSADALISKIEEMTQKLRSEGTATAAGQADPEADQNG